MTTDPIGQPDCKFEEGCHRVVPCDPGCGAPQRPAGRDNLRDRIAAAIAADDGHPWDTLCADTQHHYLDNADAVLAWLPPPADRAAALLSAADGFDRHAERILEGVGDKAVFVAKALRDQAAVRREAAETLRRLAAEAPQPEAPWATDSARIGRVLIWSHAQVGRSDFGQGYRTAQEDVRAILTRPLLAAAAEAQQPDTGAQPATTPDAKPVCICGHPVITHHEDVCLRADCHCADVLEIGALPEALEAVLTKRFTELGNQFAEMRVHEQGPDGWPSIRPVSPHMVAEALRQLLPAQRTAAPAELPAAADTGEEAQS